MANSISTHKLTLYKLVLHNGWEIYVVAPNATDAERTYEAYRARVQTLGDVIAIHIIASPKVKGDLLIAEGILHG